MTPTELGAGAGAVFCAFMGVFQQYRFKRLRVQMQEHSRNINSTPIKLERLRLEVLELADAMLLPESEGNRAWRIRKIEAAREKISQLPLLTAEQYRIAQDEE